MSSLSDTYSLRFVVEIWLNGIGDMFEKTEPERIRVWAYVWHNLYQVLILSFLL